MTKQAKGLGKGLSALIPDNSSYNNSDERVVLLDIDRISAGEGQPRKFFDEEKLQELALSIEQHGLVQPVLVVKKGADYHLVAGERRYRAAKLAKLKQIPCIVRSFSTEEMREIALIENVQREDLNAVEEAEALQSILQNGGYTQEELAAKVGKSRPYVANSLRLLTLEDNLRQQIVQGVLTAGHGRALLQVKAAANRQLLAAKIVRDGLSVRQAEELARAYNGAKQDKKERPQPTAKTPLLRDIEKRLRDRLGTKVKLTPKGKGGLLTLEYYGDDDLQRLLDTIIPDEKF